MALLQTSNRRIHKAYIRTRDYNFSLNELVGVDLYDKTIGVIGTGKIGKALINIALGYGMHVIAYDKYPDPNLKNVEYVSLEELFQRSDFITLHCPLTDENRHMINMDTISMMKKGVGIINTSRGGLINGEALLEGIKQRQVGFACLDVYEEEGDLFYQDKSGHILDDDTLRSLISMPNVIITSHQAFLTKEALNNIAETTVHNILSYFNDGDNINEVCYHCSKIENCKKKRHLKCF
jgi:D-lactate dehydrogenase